MAQNLVIDGNIFNGVDSISMTNEAGEKVTYIEKTNPGTGVSVAQIGERQFYTVEDALAAAVSGDTVTMIADSVENVNLVIPAGVTLNLQGYMLTADSVVGLDGSKLGGAADTNRNGELDAGGVLKVSREKLKLCAEPYVTNNQIIVPIWDCRDGNECYRFSQIIVNTSTTNRRLIINEEEDYLSFQFKIQATSDLLNVLMKNYGGSESAYGVKLRVEWEDTGGNGDTTVLRAEVFYNDTIVKASAGNPDFFSKITGISALGINTETLKVYAVLTTDSGVTVYGDKWNADGIIQ